jgi:4'-phosphopantetheinyl transferase
MPLIFKDFHSDFHNKELSVSIGIWECVENETFFEQSIQLYSEEVNELTNTSPRKQLEWLSSRYLLQLLTGKNYRLATIKDENGKPYLIGSNQHISLSHSSKFTAAVISSEFTGIDIQYYTDKIERIKKKFLSDKEDEYYALNPSINLLHIYWGAKEALFKVYGKGSVDFKKHLYIEPFSIEKEGEFIGNILKDDVKFRYNMKYILHDEYVLVYVINLL